MGEPAPQKKQTRVVSGLGELAERKRRGDAAQPLPQLELDPRTYDRALDCVHCGLCLPACPTYTQNGLEADSPRGRIHLMKGLADGIIEPSRDVRKHLDLCLDCRACETACPSGVVYHELIEETRSKLDAAGQPTFGQRVSQWMFYHVFPFATRLKLALLPARLLQRVGVWQWLTHSKLGSLLGPELKKMQQMLPSGGPLWERRLASFYPAKAPDGPKQATVVFFPGCVGSVLFQEVNRQSIALLQHAGCDVHVPRAQQCCGAIHHHGGRVAEAAKLAMANIDAVEAMSGEADYVVNAIAGCGAMLRDYAHLLRDDQQYAAKAKQYEAKVRDISEVLDAVGMAPPTHRLNRKATYHDACHLAHAQKVTDPPRRLLSSIKGLELVPLPESDMCCGAAGTYNLQQPAMAMDLGARKLRHIQSTGCDTCVTGNVGCAMQVHSEAQRLGVDLKVMHPVTLLYEATFGGGEER